MVQEVVIALAQATGRTGRYTLVERWRNAERLLPVRSRPLSKKILNCDLAERDAVDGFEQVGNLRVRRAVYFTTIWRDRFFESKHGASWRGRRSWPIFSVVAWRWWLVGIRQESAGSPITSQPIKDAQLLGRSAS